MFKANDDKRYSQTERLDALKMAQNDICVFGFRKIGQDLLISVVLLSWILDTGEAACSTPPTVTHGSYSPIQGSYSDNETVTYACETGYAHNTGDLTVTCDTTSWVGTVPTCTITCTTPDIKSNSNIMPMQASYVNNTAVTYTCDVGYEPAGGDATRTCTSNATWIGVALICSIITCTAPLVTGNTSITPVQASYDFNTSVTYSCHVGYEEASGNLTRTCTASAAWSDVALSCTMIKCTPDYVPNSAKTPDQLDYLYNTQVTYSCNPGYNYTSGDLTRTCRANKKWSGTMPVCTTCAPPGNITLASMSPLQSIYNYNQYVVYTCAIGYRVGSGSAIRICTENETWSGVAPVCVNVTCAAPSTVAHSSVSPDIELFYYAEVIVFTCDTGYERTAGNLVRTCSQNGWFNGTAPVCPIKTCNKIDVANGTAFPDQPNYDYNTSVTYSCNLAFNHTAGDLVRTCDDTANWTETLPTCTVAACLPDLVPHSTLSPNEITYEFDTIVTYVCTLGYYIESGDEIRTCQNSGLWNGTAPACSRVTCETPAIVNDSTYTPVPANNRHVYNTSITYTCNLAYNHTAGDLTRTCKEDFTWSGSAPVCTVSACIQEDAAFMTTTPNQILHQIDNNLEYECIVGYNYSTGDVTRMCTNTGQWNGTLPTCVIVECELPPAINYTTVAPTQGVYVYLDVITYTCITGYEQTSGDASRTCTETSGWNETAPVCTIIHCPPPPAGTRNTYAPVQVEYEWLTEAEYTCDIGYNQSSGNQLRTCNDDKTWNGTTPVCSIVTCNIIDVPRMTFTPPSTTTHDFNTTIEYSCDVGYNHSYGDLQRTCNYTGIWTGDLPNCTLITCDPPDPVNNAHYSPNQTEHNWNTDIVYECDAGYHYVIGSDTNTCNETGVFPPSDFNCSSLHTLVIGASEPNITWMNSTTSASTIVFDFDGMCDVKVTSSSALLNVSHVISGTNIIVYVADMPNTTLDLYQVRLDPFRAGRTWPRVEQTVFYGEGVLGFQAWSNNTIMYFAVDRMYQFEANATHGTNVTVDWQMETTVTLSSPYSPYTRRFTYGNIEYTYHSPGIYNVNVTASNLVSSVTVTIPVIVIYVINNIQFSVDSLLANTTLAAVFEFTVIDPADLTMGVVNVFINYKHGTNTSVASTLDETISLPAVYPYSHLFDIQGEYLVEARAENSLGFENYSINIQVWDTLNPLDLEFINGNGKYITNTTMELTFTNVPNAGFKYSVDFGDGFLNASIGNDILYDVYSLTSFSHVYTSAGVYTVTWSAENGFYRRNEQFTVLVQNIVPILGYTLEPNGKKYPWKNLQYMHIPVNLTLNDTVPLPTNATCIFDAQDHNSSVSNLTYDSAFLEYNHNYTSEGSFISTLNCSNEVSNYLYEYNITVQKYEARFLNVEFEHLIPLNISDTVTVYFHIDNGGFELIPLQVTLDWNFGDGTVSRRRRSAVGYDRATYSHLYSKRGDYEVNLTVFANVTNTTHTLSYKYLRLGIMRFEYNSSEAFINTTVIRYNMTGVLGTNTTYTIFFDDETDNGVCDSSNYTGCVIDHMCPYYGYKNVSVVARNDTFVEVDGVRIACDNPIPEDLTLEIPESVTIPDGWITLYLKLKVTDLYLPMLYCDINMGDPIKRQTYRINQTVTYDTPFTFSFQYLSLGKHSVNMHCWNLINQTDKSVEITVKNIDFLPSNMKENHTFYGNGIFDRTYSQANSPLLISSMRDTEVFSRLIIFANFSEKSHVNKWVINATTNEVNMNRHGLLFTIGMTEEKQYYVELHVHFKQDPANIIFEPTYIKVVMPPPHAEISGGTRRIVNRDNIMVDAASVSYDPAHPTDQNIDFIWDCNSYDATSFEDAATKHITKNGAQACTYTTPATGQLLLNTITAPVLPYYVVKLTIDNRRGGTATFTQVLKISLSVTELSIRCKINCLSKVAISSNMQLVTSVTNNCPATFTWKLQSQSGGSYGSYKDLTTMTGYGYRGRSLTISAHKLSPGTWYLVTLDVTLNGMKYGPAYYEFATNRLPQGGECDVFPFDDLYDPLPDPLPTSLNYTANMQKYNISCKHWQDEGFTDAAFSEEQPMFYYFFLTFSNDNMQRQILYFDPGATSNIVTFQVGDPTAGYNASLVVRITDVIGDYTELMYPVVSQPALTTGQLALLSTSAEQLIAIKSFIEEFDDELLKANESYDYRTLSRKIQGIASVYNALVINTSSAVTLVPEDLTSLGNKLTNEGELISWSDYWKDIVEKPDTSISDYIIQTGEKYTSMLYNSIITWPSNKRLTLVAIETLSRALEATIANPELSNDTAAIWAAEAAETLAQNLADNTNDRTFPNTGQVILAAVGIQDLIRNVLVELQTVLTPNLPEDPTVDQMRYFLEYIRIFKTDEEIQGEPLSLQEQTFLAQKQLQKYDLQQSIKSEWSKKALPFVTNALRSLIYVLSTMTHIGQDEMYLENDLIYISIEIKPAYELISTTVQRPHVAMKLGLLIQTSSEPCNSGEVNITTVVFKQNPYFWGQFGDRITSYVPVFQVEGAILTSATITYRLLNAEEPECIDETPTYDADDPDKMIYILFDRRFGDDDILLFVKPNASLVYQLYLNVDVKPSVEENRYVYSTKMSTEMWTEENGYNLLIKSSDFSAVGKIWIALRPLLKDTGNDSSVIKQPFCANVTSVSCLSWRQGGDGEYFWDKAICEVSRASTFTETVCICKNQGDGAAVTLGTTFYVPPNKIDYLKESVEILPLGNLPVIGLIITTMFAYVLIVCWAWREDAKDQYKWSFSLLIDNDIADSFFFIIRVYTGLRTGAGTQSKIGFVLVGDELDTGERILDDAAHVGFETGSVRIFIMSCRVNLGDLISLRIWHDDTGGNESSWYLNKITVMDMQTANRYAFVCDHWFDFDRGDTKVDRVLNACPIRDAITFKEMATYTIAENHLWLSVAMSSMKSNFTRIQRVSCLLGLIYLTMVVLTMILKTSDTYPIVQQVVIGPFIFHKEGFEGAMISVFVATVIILLVSFFFRNSKAGKVPNDVNSILRKAYRAVNDRIKLDKSYLGGVFRPPAEDAVVYDYYFLPHFCVYVGWFILAVAIGLATYLLISSSDTWKLVKSEEWMTSVLVALLGSVLILEAIKVQIILLFYCLMCKRGYEVPEPSIDVDSLFEITKHNSATLTISPQFSNVLHTPQRPDKETLLLHKIKRIANHQLLKIFYQLALFSGVLFIVITISFESRDVRSFYLKNHLENTFQFQTEVTDMKSYKEWLKGRFVDSYFSSTYYGLVNPAVDLRLYAEDLANLRVGPARLRQLRIESEACKGPLGVNVTCHNQFEDSKAETTDYCLNWKPLPCDASEKSTFFTSAGWLFKSAEEVWGLTTFASYGTYGGGGYFLKLDVNKDVCLQMFEELRKFNWFDRQTRAIILEFTVYNGNSNLFAYSKFVAEFPEVGGVMTYIDIQVFRLYSDFGPKGNYVQMLEFSFLVIVLAATVYVFYEISTDIKAFFKSVWNCLDVLALVMSYITISVFIFKIFVIKRTIEVFHNDKNAYVGFEHLALYDFVVNSAHGVLVFLLSIRVSRILGYSGKINEMAEVISHAAGDLLGFVVIFGITYFTYVAFGTLLFGKDTEKYRDVFQTYGTLTEAVIGKNRLTAIMSVKPGFAEFYYFTFVLFVLLTLATMAAAILNFSIAHVKREQEILAPTSIVEIIFNRIIKLFGVIGGSNKTREPKLRRDSEVELIDILSELRLFINSVYSNSKTQRSDKYKIKTPERSRSPSP